MTLSRNDVGSGVAGKGTGDRPLNNGPRRSIAPVNDGTGEDFRMGWRTKSYRILVILTGHLEGHF